MNDHMIYIVYLGSVPACLGLVILACSAIRSRWAIGPTELRPIKCHACEQIKICSPVTFMTANCVSATVHYGNSPGYFVEVKRFTYRLIDTVTINLCSSCLRSGYYLRMKRYFILLSNQIKSK